MKWSPRDFWASTPYDCLLASGGLAHINSKSSDSKKLSKSDVNFWKNHFAKEKLKNGQG